MDRRDRSEDVWTRIKAESQGDIGILCGSRDPSRKAKVDTCNDERL